MNPPEISALSKEYVRVRVQLKVNGIDTNPTSDAVSMAFMSGTTAPSTGDFKTGSWETDATTSPATYWARCLVGPGGGVITLTAGLYNVWLQITDSPEVPVRKCGLLRVI